jgi:hypothetical protein
MARRISPTLLSCQDHIKCSEGETSWYQQASWSYSVSDSLRCSQQKCLLHLVRDLNDGILDNPYDDIRRIDALCPWLPCVIAS